MEEFPVHPQIEIPVILQTHKEGNPYKWVPLYLDNETLAVPKLKPEGGLYLFSTYRGEEYHAVFLNPDMSLFKFRTCPFAYWFSKPLNAKDRIPNHISPIVMEEGVDYLVEIHGKLKFINTQTLMRDNLPITAWYDTKDLFPIR